LIEPTRRHIALVDLEKDRTRAQPRDPAQIEIEQLPRQGRARVRWIYRRARRTLLFEDGRVVSIAIR